MAEPIETRFCEHCKKPVTRGHTTCESCGTRLKTSHKRTRWVIGVLVAAIALFAIVSISKYMSADRFESPQQTGQKAAGDQ